MKALSIRQPYAELILRGEKTIEYRSRPTKRIGERFFIYAARKWAGVPPVNGHQTGNGEWAMGNGSASLPTGVIVGTAIISRCVGPLLPIDKGRRITDFVYEWHLTSIKRFKTPRKPKRQPQPVWFRPF